MHYFHIFRWSKHTAVWLDKSIILPTPCEAEFPQIWRLHRNTKNPTVFHFKLLPAKPYDKISWKFKKTLFWANVRSFLSILGHIFSNFLESPLLTLFMKFQRKTHICTNVMTSYKQVWIHRNSYKRTTCKI